MGPSGAHLHRQQIEVFRHEIEVRLSAIRFGCGLGNVTGTEFQRPRNICRLATHGSCRLKIVLVRGDHDKVLTYVKDLRRQGVPSTITLYAIRDLKGEERQAVLAIKKQKQAGR